MEKLVSRSIQQFGVIMSQHENKPNRKSLMRDIFVYIGSTSSQVDFLLPAESSEKWS